MSYIVFTPFGSAKAIAREAPLAPSEPDSAFFAPYDYNGHSISNISFVPKGHLHSPNTNSLFPAHVKH